MRAVLFVLIYFLSSNQSSLWGTSIEFFKGDLQSAQLKAKEEGKHLFLDFYASWCGPCRWMENTTFADPAVIEKLNEDFITLKVNIDDFEGYRLKEHYKINVLPTLLIFDEQGQIIERVEETVSATNMQAVLQRALTKPKVVLHQTNVSPSATTLLQPQDSQEDTLKSPINYKLQLAVFTDYARTLKFYNKLSPAIPKPIIIHYSYLDGKINYRVMVTNFTDKEEALLFKKVLIDEMGIDSFIKS